MLGTSTLAQLYATTHHMGIYFYQLQLAMWRVVG